MEHIHKKEYRNAKANLIIDYVDKYFDTYCRVKNRKNKNVLARQISCYFIYTLFKKKMSLESIGMLFPARTKGRFLDHATVSFAVTKITDLYAFDKEIIKYVDELKEYCEQIINLSDYEIVQLRIKKEIFNSLSELSVDSLLVFQKKSLKLIDKLKE